MPDQIIVFDDLGAVLAETAYLPLFAFLFLIVLYIALIMCKSIIATSPNSSIRTNKCTLLRKLTILLKFSFPVKRTRLLNKWNNKKIESANPENAICIFWPMDEKRNLNILNLNTKRECHHLKILYFVLIQDLVQH